MTLGSGAGLGAARDQAPIRRHLRAAGRVGHRVPDIPMLPTPIRADGPLEPLGETLTLNGIRIEEGKVIARNIVIAPRLGAALKVPVCISGGLPVGLELDALPGHDTELLGVGMVVESFLGRPPAPLMPRR